MPVLRAAAGILVAWLLVGCAGSPFGGAAPVAEATLDIVMTGRWILAAPNSPSCGMNFAGAPDALAGRIEPEGGCPGRFYTSRRWTLDKGTLTIAGDRQAVMCLIALYAATFASSSQAQARPEAAGA